MRPSALALLALAWAGTARAEQDQVVSRLAPTPQQLEAERTLRLERRIEETLNLLPALHAKVRLALPSSLDPLDVPARRPSATVVVEGHADVFPVLHTFVPNLSREDLTLIERTPIVASPAPVGTSLVQIGPFRVHPDSAFGVRAVFAISLLANAFLAALVLLRLRGSRSRPADRAES